VSPFVTYKHYSSVLQSESIKSSKCIHCDFVRICGWDGLIRLNWKYTIKPIKSYKRIWLWSSHSSEFDWGQVLLYIHHRNTNHQPQIYEHFRLRPCELVANAGETCRACKIPCCIRVRCNWISGGYVSACGDDNLLHECKICWNRGEDTQTGPVGRLRLSDDRLFVGLPCLDPHVIEVCGVIVLISFVVNRKPLYGGKKVFIRNFGHQPGDSW
jgi:hypothetical protein